MVALAPFRLVVALVVLDEWICVVFGCYGCLFVDCCCCYSVARFAVAWIAVIVSSQQTIVTPSTVGGWCPFKTSRRDDGPCVFFDSGSSAPSLITTSRISFSAWEAV